MDEAEVLAALAPRLGQFLAVAGVEHMTRAAQETGVPQSTLSRGIARLEAELGVDLFVRSGRTVRLSRAGRTLLRHAERAAAELTTGVQEVRGDADPVRGRVGLAFLSSLGSTTVPRLLRDFRVAHPDVRFDLVQGRHALLLDRLRAGDVDLALTSTEPDDAGLVVEPLADEELRLTVPAEHRFAGRVDGIALAEAADETFIGFQPGLGLRSALARWTREAGFRPRVAFESGDAETVRGLVGAGLGVALLPVAPHPLGSDVVEVAVHTPRTARTIALVAVAGRPLTAPALALRDLVRSRPLP